MNEKQHNLADKLLDDIGSLSTEDGNFVEYLTMACWNDELTNDQNERLLEIYDERFGYGVEE